MSLIEMSNPYTSRKLGLNNEVSSNQLNFRHGVSELPHQCKLAFFSQSIHEILLLLGELKVYSEIY